MELFYCIGGGAWKYCVNQPRLFNRSLRLGSGQERMVFEKKGRILSLPLSLCREHNGQAAESTFKLKADPFSKEES